MAEAGAVLGRLAGRLPSGAVVTDPDVMGRFVHDEAEWAPFGKPAAVVRPRTTAEVAEVVSACAATGTPLVTRGAGTGLSGGANAVDGCVILSTELMTGIRSVDAANQIAVVEPGVINDDLRRAMAA